MEVDVVILVLVYGVVHYQLTKVGADRRGKMPRLMDLFPA